MQKCLKYLISCGFSISSKYSVSRIQDPIKDIPNGVCLTGFYSNYPTQEVMQDIFRFMDEHELKPLIGLTYDFEHIRDACIALDSGKVNGKIVIIVNQLEIRRDMSYNKKHE